MVMLGQGHAGANEGQPNGKHVNLDIAGRGEVGQFYEPITHTMTITGSTIINNQRHDKTCRMNPATVGPIAGAVETMRLEIPIMVPRFPADKSKIRAVMVYVIKIPLALA